MRKITITAATTALAIGSVAVATASPVAAATSSSVHAGSWAYTDATAPGKSHVNGPEGLPIGVWRDSAHRTHLSRAYYTFALSSYAGSEVTSALLGVDELAVNDCTATTIIGVYQTTAFNQPTWLHPPTEQLQLVDLPSYPAGCPAHESWDITPAVNAAVAAGKPTVTIELRVPNGSEHDPHYGRRFSTAAVLSVMSNRLPVVGNLRVGDTPCGAQLVYTSNPRPGVSVDVIDPDQVSSAVEFGIGPAADPTQRTQFSGGGGFGSWTSTAIVPNELASGTYQLTARPIDPGLIKPPGRSVSCRIVVDRNPPTTAPTVSSDVYLPGAAHGRTGLAGNFTFDAHGDRDVVAFRWGLLPDGPTESVPAGRPGGTATVQWTPTASGAASLVVVGVDRAGNASPQAQYDFVVASTAPTIEDHNPDAPFGQPRTITFHPNMPGVTEYVYTFNTPTPHTIPAGADGTATVVLVFNSSGGNSLYVYSRDAAGSRSDTAYVNIQPRSAPTVTSVQYPIGDVVGAPAGTPGVFVVTSFVPNVVSYTYQFDKGPKTTAATDANGNLVINYTPLTSGPHTLGIGFGVLADGTTVDGGSYPFIAG